jgi:hypothetical protein
VGAGGAAGEVGPDAPLPRREGAQGGLAGDVCPGMDAEFLQDVGDVGRDGPPGQHQLDSDFRIGQPLGHEGGDLALGRCEAVPAAAGLPVPGARPEPDAVGAECGLEPGDVGGRAQGGVDLHGGSERGPCLTAVAGAEEFPCGRLERFRSQQRPAGVLIPLGGREQPGGVVLEQPAAVQRVGVPVRDLRPGREGSGLAGEGLRRGQVAGLDGEADGVA